MGRVPLPKHSRPRRARIVLGPVAEQQTETFSIAEAVAVERALAALAIAPGLGDVRPDGLCDYQDDGGARVLYFVTVLHMIVIVAYLEA